MGVTPGPILLADAWWMDDNGSGRGWDDEEGRRELGVVVIFLDALAVR
jgi:hypothetical protein